MLAKRYFLSLGHFLKKAEKGFIMGTNNAKKEMYIVRGDRSGVFYGEIKERNGREVTMTNVRRLWYWDGANSISQLAKMGTVRPHNCKFTCSVDEVLVLDVIEINKCSEEAIKSIDGVLEWTKK